MSVSPSVTLLKGLGCHTRIKIMLLIRQEGELCVCELTQALDESQPKISRNLALLREAGLLEDTRQGQWVFYRFASLPEWVEHTLQGIAQAEPELINPCFARLANMGDRPQRLQNCCI